MTASRHVMVGQRYQTSSAPGGALPTIWQIVGVYVPWEGGFEHARLRSVDDRAETMTLAVSVVPDRKRFIEIAE